MSNDLLRILLAAQRKKLVPPPQVTGRFIFNAQGADGSTIFVDDSGNYTITTEGTAQIATIQSQKVAAMGSAGKLLVPADVFNLRRNNRQQTTIKARMYMGTSSNDRYAVFFDSRHSGTWPGMILYYDRSANILRFEKREEALITHYANLSDSFCEIALYISNLTDGYADVVLRVNGISVYSGNIYTKIVFNPAWDMLDTGVYTFYDNIIGGACDNYYDTYLKSFGVWDLITDDADYAPDFSKPFV